MKQRSDTIPRALSPRDQALAASTRLWHDIFDAIEDPVAVIDCQQRVTSCNKSMANLLERAFKDIVGRPCYQLVHGTAKHVKECPLVRVRQTRRREAEVLPMGDRWFQITIDPLMDEVGTLVGYVHIMSDITARRQAEEEAQRHLQRVTALHTIGMAIAASLDLRVALNVLLDQVAAQLRADAASVLLLDPQTQVLEYAAGRGFRTAALHRTRLRLGEGHAGRAAQERRILNIPNLPENMGDLARAPLLVSEDFVTYHAAPLLSKGQVKGVLEVFHRVPLEPDQGWLHFLEALADQAAIAIDNATLFDDLQSSNIELTLAYEATLEGWVRALDLRHKETEGHTRRVTELTLQLARAFGLAEAEAVHVRRGALLHDIGKLGVPDSTLLKPGPLTEEEWATMRRHPEYAYRFLSPIAFLRPALDIPYCHHEKWDGTGYPRGLREQRIPLAARIFAVVDVWDSLRSDRVYRPAWPEGKVREQIQSLAGAHFDPQVVPTLFRVVATGAAK